MKPNWTKADCRRLRDGSPGKLETWVRDYADSLYTWVIYHYAVDSSEARDRTVRIFQGVFSQAGDYDPAASSMYLWLIGRAETFYPKESQEPFVPGRSGQPISPDDLQSLLLLGSQDLPDALLEKPAVVQLLQAVLTEMDEPERRVLLRRYHRIDRTGPAGLDAEYSAGIPDDPLVRARYYLRRTLFSRIHSFYPEAGEFMPDARIAVFEKNLEKIFCSIAPFLKLPEAFLENLIGILNQQADQIRLVAPSDQAFWKKPAWAGTAAVLLLMTGTGVYFLFREQPVPVTMSRPVQDTLEADKKPPAAKSKKTEMTQEELSAYMNRVFAAGAEGRTEDLLQALEAGPEPARVAAAIYLGRIGDESVIGPLERAIQRWYPNAIDDNPFLTAIEQIEQRLRREAAEAEEARLREAGDAEAKATPPAETNVLETDPNLAVKFQFLLERPADVNERLLEVLVQRGLLDPNVLLLRRKIQEKEQLIMELLADPNTPGLEDANSTNEIQYIEGGV